MPNDTHGHHKPEIWSQKCQESGNQEPASQHTFQQSQGGRRQGRSLKIYIYVYRIPVRARSAVYVIGFLSMQQFRSLSLACLAQLAQLSLLSLIHLTFNCLAQFAQLRLLILAPLPWISLLSLAFLAFLEQLAQLSLAQLSLVQFAQLSSPI